MNLYHLKYFYDAVVEGGVGESAKKNHVTQSAVSQSIRRIEEELECELLIHRKNRFALTDAGRVVYEKCQNIFQSVEHLKTEAKMTQNQFSGSVVFATSHSIALSILPRFLALMKKKYPKVTPKFRLGKTPIVKRWLEDREIEFGVTVDDGQLRSLSRQVVHSGRFSCVHRPKVSASSEFLLTESRPETEALRKAFRVRHGRSLPVAAEVDSWEIIKRLSLEGMGIGFLPEFAIDAGARKRLKVFRESWLPKMTYDLCVIQNEGIPAARLTILFIEELAAFLSVVQRQ